MANGNDHAVTEKKKHPARSARPQNERLIQKRPPVMRVTRTIPESLIREIKAAAAIEGRGFNDIFVEALKQYVDSHEDCELIKKVASRRGNK